MAAKTQGGESLSDARDVFLSRLIGALRERRLDPSAEDVADILWLAAYQGKPQSVPKPGEKPPSASRQKEPEGKDKEPEREPKSEIATKGQKQGKREGDGEAPVYPRGSTGKGRIQRGTPIRIPGGRALPGTIEIARALRPLMRRVPSRQFKVFDERATVRRIAEDGLWMPVFRPAPERWLSLELLIDDSPSMRIWDRTVGELKTLLYGLGAFQNGRSWSLATGDPETVTISTASGLPGRSTQELLDSTGRRLLLVVTDCVAPVWRSVRMKELLEAWAGSQSVALVQLLPQRLWSRTGLACASFVRVRAPEPGVASGRLKVMTLRPRRLRQGETRLPIPITTLEPAFVASWARLVGGMAGQAPAVILYPEVVTTPSAKDRSVEERLRAFRSSASPLAFRLACLLAAAPLSLPVMRMVQSIMLPHSRQSHLAEFFLSGLLLRSDDVFGYSYDEILYDFIPGIRDLLLDAGEIPDAIQVQRILSRHVKDHYGQALDFQAVLDDPEGAEASSLDETSRHFVMISAMVLERLGGIYAQAAKRIVAGRRPHDASAIRHLTGRDSPRTLTWLHFSDLHVNRPKTGWDAQEVLDLLLKDMTNVREQHGLEPDLIFFTGDAAFGDKDPEKLADQFGEAEKLFEEVRKLFGVPKERFFIVPGNHDVHRAAVADSEKDWIDALARKHGKNAVDVVHETMRDNTTQWKRFMERLEGYRELLVVYDYDHLLKDPDRLLWWWREDVGGVDVAVAGLNTAWACHRDGENGQLWTGLEWQIKTARHKLLEKTGKPDVTIALTHHPDRWLHEHEGNQVERLLESSFDLHLHGHEHEDWIAEKKGHARVGAAACYAKGPRERGYNFGRLHVDDGNGNVWLRMYDSTGSGWVLRPIAEKAPKGVWTFHLRPEVEAPPKERGPKPGPETRGVFRRDKDVRKLARLVSQRPLVSVYGLTGVGKTTLVEELLHTEEHAGLGYHRVLVRKEATFKGLFQQLAPVLGASGDQDAESRAVLNPHAALEKWTKKAKPTLIHLERADLLFDDTGERFRDRRVGDFLAAVADKCGNVRVVLEGRRAPGKDVFAAGVHEAMRVGGLDKDDLDAFLRTPQPSRTTVWTLNADAVAEVFERLGGGPRRKGKAHPLGMVLLASLAASLGETPHDVVRRYPDAFAEELERKIFHEIYDEVLDDVKRRLLDLCALYRAEIPVRHVGALQEHVGDGGEQAFDVLLRLCLLRPDAREERFTLHGMIADLVRRRHKDDDDDGHHLVGKLWLGDAKGLRRLPQILAASEAVYHLVLGQSWELLADVQGRLLQDDVVAALREVSRNLYSSRRYQEDRRVLELMVLADEADHMSHRFLGERIETLEGDGAADAYPHYEAAYDLKPDFAPYVNNLMRYLEKDDPQRCVEIGEKAIADGVANDHIYAVLANALEELGREDEASELRQERIDAGSQNAAVYNDEAVLLDRRGRKAEALSVLGLAFKRGIANQHSRAIRDRLVGGDAASASRQEAIRNGSTDPVHYNDEAVYLAELGRTEEALDVLRAAVERGIANDYTYAVQAKLLEKTGKADEASRLRRSRIDAGSHNPVFYNDEAILLDKQGRTEEALDVLRTAVDLGIANDYIYTLQAKLLRRMGG